MTDTETNLEQIARFASGLKSIQGVDLLPFHRIASGKYRRLGLADPMAGAEPPFPDHVAVIKNRFESAGFDVSIGG
jgi:pyruvate formate lyase activating enzyme